VIYVRTRYLCACVAITDAAVIFGGVPLQRVSWSTAMQPDPDAHTVLMLIAANVALLVVALIGLSAAAILGRRGVRFAFKRVSKSFARPTRV
jgi:hypothetical protein